MNYAWEILLQADCEQKERNEIRFVNAANPSPYLEVAFEDLNADCIETETVEVNPLYQFGKELAPLFDQNREGCEQTRAVFFDICMHYISQLDLRQGLSRQDFYVHLLQRDIAAGMFGKEAKGAMRLFTGEERKIWLPALFRLLRNHNYMQEFRHVITGIYPQSCLYENNDRANELLVYLGAEETVEEEERIQLLIRLFLPMQGVVHVFYQNHFGIIGVDETMQLDEMMLF